MRRVDFDPRELGAGVYPLLNSLVVPRPIAWVSTRSADGVDNLAPHSFFTVSSVVPPVVQFTSVGIKDSLRNVRETGEFVVSVVSRALSDSANRTATGFPPDVDEFAEAGVTSEPSQVVAPLRVAQSPAVLECCLIDERSFGDSTVVFGEVLHIAVDETLFRDGHIAPDLLDPAARLGGPLWSALGDIYAIERIPLDQWPGTAR